MSDDSDNANGPADDRAVEALPLDAWHRARGARMVPFAGYAMPIQYEGIMAEHGWTRTHAGLFDVSHMGQLLFSTEDGSDPAAALEALLPGDIGGLKPGRMRYSLLLDEQGGILDDLMVTRTSGGPFGDARIYMVVNGATKWDDIAWLREHLPDEIVINHLDDQALLALQGPEAAAALAALVPGVEALFFMQAGAFTWEGAPLWVSRSGYTGEDGFEISVPAGRAAALADALLARPQVKPVGLGARDSLRLEAGLPLYGHDLTPQTGPVGAGLTFALSKRRREAGGFMGHEAVARDLAEGPARRWVGIRLEGRLPAREGADIFLGDQKVGVVTSGGFGPTVGAPIAMGWIDAACAEPGRALEIDVRGKRLSATVSPTPFVPHRYHRQGAKP